jgi:hypothetical protein
MPTNYKSMSILRVLRSIADTGRTFHAAFHGEDSIRAGQQGLHSISGAIGVQVQFKLNEVLISKNSS